MRFRTRRWRIAMALFILVASALAGCSVQPPKGRKPSPDWSRAKYLGQFVDGLISVALDEDGSYLHVVWPSQIGGSSGIHYVKVGREAEVVADQELPLPAGNLRSARLVPDGQGRFHLFWAARSSGQANWVLWHTLLDDNGGVAGRLSQITGADVRIGSYEAASDGAGNAFVTWDRSDSGGILGLQVNPDGSFEPDPMLLSAAGEAPAIQIDSVGTRHLAWRQENQVFYLSLSAGNQPLTRATPVATRGGGTGISLQGPRLGLSQGWVYVLWYLQNLSGLEAGTARTEFVALPNGGATTLPPTTVGLYGAETLPYEAYQGSYSLSQIVPPAAPQFFSDFVYQPRPVAGERGDLAVALSHYQEFRQDVYAQTAVAIFRDGSFVGYEPASKTEGLSQEATLAADPAGNLYMVWREGAAGNRAYYATTEPMAREILDKLDGQDMMHALLRGSMEGLSSLAMLPFALVWIAPGVVFLIVVELFWAREKQSLEMARVILGVAVIVYLAIKLVLFPTIVSYVPFSAWLDISERAGAALQILVPLSTLGLGLLVATWVRRKRNESNLAFFFALAATDALLTLIVYGVNFWSLA